MTKRFAIAELPFRAISPLWLELDELESRSSTSLRINVMEAIADELDQWEPKRCVSPSQDLLAIRSGLSLGQGGDPRDNYQLCALRWGMIPAWANRRRTGERLLLAPAETLLDAPAFRRPLRLQRCIIPISAYYDWLNPKDELRPLRFGHTQESILFVAGLWDQWTSPLAEVFESCAVITTRANAAISQHGLRQMPTILTLDAARRWLDPTASLDEVAELATQTLSAEQTQIAQLRSPVRPDRTQASKIRRAPEQLDMLRQLQERARRALEDHSTQARLPI